MKSYVMPAVLAVLVFIASLAAAINSYTTGGSISLADAALMIAAVALGVLSQRIYVMEKEISELKEAVFEDDDEEESGEDDGGEN